MVSVPGRFALVGLILLACGASAFGGNYADPSGFSFDYPDGWIPVTRVTAENLNRALPDELRTWISKNNVDLTRVAVVLLRNGRDEFLENLNVSVIEQQIPVDDKTVKKLTEQLVQQFGAMNAKIDNVQGRVQKVGPHDAVVAEYRMRLPGIPHVFRQRQVMFPGGGKTYIVTCTAKADSFDSYQPTFERILASFRVPAPVKQGGDLGRGVIMGVIGGITGVLACGMGWLRKKPPSKANPEAGERPV